MTTVINGNGWYLFGIADGQKIAKLVKAGDNTANNFLNNHIVKNHSANVETAYIVEKHNPVTAWIKAHFNDNNHTSPPIYYAKTNMSGTTKYYQWFIRDDSSDQWGQIQAGEGEDHISSQSSWGDVKVVITNHQNTPTEKVTAELKDVVIIGIEKNDTETEPIYNTQASWAFEPNTVLEAIVNKPGLVPDFTYTWSVGGVPTSNPPKNDDGEDETNKFIVTGPNIGKEIRVSVAEKNTGNTLVQSPSMVDTYDTSIGASVSPFESRNWKKIIYPYNMAGSDVDDDIVVGVSEWTNSTGITLGIWVNITGFADTVPPIPTNLNLVSPTSWIVNSSNNTAQYIDITFTKEIKLPYFNLNDFKITVTDVRNKTGNEVNGTNDISDQIPKYNSGTEMSPEAAEVDDGSNFSNKILRLTLPTREGVDAYYPYVFAGDNVHFSFIRTGDGTGTILKDISEYNGTTENPPRTMLDDSDYYGGRDGEYGNLVANFDSAVNNGSTFDNRSPTITNAVVNTIGNTIDITFNTNIENTTMPAGGDFTITYRDWRSDVQKGTFDGATWNKIDDISSSTYTTVIRSVDSVTRYSAKVIRLTLNDYIYQNHTDSKHEVFVSYTKPNSNALTDDSNFKNKVNDFTNITATNSSTVNNTYPTLNISSAPSLSATTETNKDTNLLTLTVNGPSKLETTTDWTLIETDSSGTALTTGNDNFYISAYSYDDDTTIRTDSNSIQIKIKHKPNFSYIADDTTMLTGWDTTTGGLTANNDGTSKNYYFKVAFRVVGVNGITTNSTTNLTTTTPVIILTVSSSTVKTERTTALIKANTVVNRGNIVLFWDKYTGDVGLGPFNGLTTTTTQLSGTPTFQETDNDADGVNVVNIAWDGFLAETDASFSDVTIPNSSWFEPINFAHGNRITSANYATNAPRIGNVKINGKSNFTFNDGGSGENRFNPKLVTESVSQGKVAGGAGGNFGWYEDRDVNPFLSIRITSQRKFRLVTLTEGKRNLPLLVHNSYTSAEHTRIIQAKGGQEVLDQNGNFSWKVDVINV